MRGSSIIMKYRGLEIINKANCFRNLTADVSRDCTNGCHYCYDTYKFSKMRDATRRRYGLREYSTEYVRSQLDGKSAIKDYLDKCRVVRIGAKCDIKKDDSSSYEGVRELMQLLWGHNYRYMLVTKSSHSLDKDLLADIKRHNGILSVTNGYYNPDDSKLFEDISNKDRMEVVERAIGMGIEVVLRINPIHPHYVDNVLAMLDWYKSIGGERTILEILRINSTWAKNMPKVDFSGYIHTGSTYNGYSTPPREVVEMVYTICTNYARRIGLPKVTICADHESNSKFGYRPDDMDCCQCSEIYNLPVPKLFIDSIGHTVGGELL